MVEGLTNGRCSFWSLERLMAHLKVLILEPRTPHGSGRRSAKSFSNSSNALQILHKTEHFGASGASWLKQPICQVHFKCFKILYKSFTKLNIWSVERLMAQATDLQIPFQVLQILYKPLTNLMTLELQAPHGSGSRSGEYFTNPL